MKNEYANLLLLILDLRKKGILKIHNLGEDTVTEIDCVITDRCVGFICYNYEMMFLQLMKKYSLVCTIDEFMGRVLYIISL